MTSVDLLVNTSVLGMEGRAPSASTSATCRTTRSWRISSTCRSRTPLIEAARARGLRTAEGLGMLLHQAAPAFERWFGAART